MFYHFFNLLYTIHCINCLIYQIKESLNTMSDFKEVNKFQVSNIRITLSNHYVIIIY